MPLELKTKHRIVGLIVIIALIVIFVPFLFTHAPSSKTTAKSDLPSQVPAPSSKPEIQLTIPLVPASPEATPSNSAGEATVANPTASPSTSTSSAPAPVSAPVSVSAATPPAVVQHQPAAVMPAEPAVEKKAVKKHHFSLERPAFLEKKHKSRHKNVPPAEAWTVQIGSFADKNNASKLVSQLRAKGFAAYINQIKDSHGIMYRVFVGPELKREKAEATVKRLQQLLNLQGVVVKYKI